VLCAAAATLGAAPARAQSASLTASPSWSDRLFVGTSPGEPSSAKLVTISSLYALSAVSLGTATYFGIASVSKQSQADSVRDASPSGFCAYGGAACDRYAALRSDQNAAAHRAWFLVGSSALLLLSAGLTAELWPNQPPARRPELGFGFAPQAVDVAVRVRFQL
jgi:hypothetical protein